MWLILQQETPEDFVLATGEMHSVREFVEKAFGVVGTQIRFVAGLISTRMACLLMRILQLGGQGC
jgi:GDP-D-mannose dehydratase